MTTSNNPNTTPDTLPTLADLTGICQRFAAACYRKVAPRVRVEPMILPRQVSDDKDATQDASFKVKKAKTGDFYTATHSGVTATDILFEALPKGIAAFQYLLVHGTGGRPKKAEKDAAIAAALQTVKLAMLEPEFSTIMTDLEALFLAMPAAKPNPTHKYTLALGAVTFTCRAKIEELVNLLEIARAVNGTVQEIPKEGDPVTLFPLAAAEPVEADDDDDMDMDTDDDEELEATA